MLSPRSERIAYQMWAFASPRGWDCTAGEVAEALGVDYRLVGRIAAAKGWGTRLRTTARDSQSGHWGDYLSNLGDFTAKREIPHYGASE